MKLDIGFCIAEWLNQDKRLKSHFYLDTSSYVRCRCSGGWWLDASTNLLCPNGFPIPNPADPEFFNDMTEWFIHMHRTFADNKKFQFDARQE